MDKEEFKNILAHGHCQGCKNPGMPIHSCPFATDIYDDSEARCNCCDECIQACAYDI